MEAVPLTSGQHADLLLLIRSSEVEPGQVGPRVDLDPAELEDFQALGNLLEHGFFRIEKNSYMLGYWILISLSII